MKKFWIQIVALTLVIFAGFYSYQNPDFLQSYLPNNTPVKQSQIKVGSKLINIEIADTSSKRAKGLGDRENIASDSGMLFVFSQSSKYQFWMKGMKIPLDIIFINDGKIVDFLKNVPIPLPNQKDSELPLFAPSTTIEMVLEVSSGFIDANNINIGDSVSLVK